MRANGFVLEEAAPEAVVIRDHARKFQFVVSHGVFPPASPSFPRGAAAAPRRRAPTRYCRQPLLPA